MTATPAVVVIGAGIQGLFSALRAVELGALVQVVEANGIASGSSSRSASMVMLQRENPAKVALSVFSYLEYQRFGQEFGVDPEFARIGFLSVVPAAARDVAVDRAVMRQSLGVPTHILDVGEIRRLEPAVDTTGIECGIFGPDDGFINVPVVVGALVSECKRRGVVLAAGVEATGLQMRNGEVSGVYTTKGSIECDQVINAAGARASEVAGWAGVDLPIRNRRRTILAVPRPDGLAPDGPMVEDAEVEYYFRRDGDRVLFGLGKDENLSLDVTLDDGILDRARGFAAKRFPSLSQMEPTDWWSGIRPLTDDMLPIIGPGGGVSGLVHTCGWGGEGIQHAPAGGRLAAEWAVLGSARSLDGSPFLPDRFALRN